MKKILIVFGLLILACNSITAQIWHTNFNQAKAMASKTGKPIVLAFQGSDWCGICIRQHKRVWSTEVFKQHAKENYVLLLADFPKRKKNLLPAAQQKANTDLALKYNKKQIFPYVVVLNEKGTVLGSTKYKRLNAESFIKVIDAFVK